MLMAAAAVWATLTTAPTVTPLVRVTVPAASVFDCLVDRGFHGRAGDHAEQLVAVPVADLVECGGDR